MLNSKGFQNEKKLANKTPGNSNKSLKKVRVIVRVRCYFRVTLRGQGYDPNGYRNPKNRNFWLRSAGFNFLEGKIGRKPLEKMKIC